MPMYDKYPYTDFHEMNLDWIIREMKQLIDDWEEFSGRVTATAHTSADPEVDVTGDLKTTLNFDFGLVQGPRGLTGAQGPQGEQGPAGEGLEILDEYVTLAALQAAHPTGNPGDAYLVGSGGSFTLYIWSTDQSAWVDAGALSSPSPSTTAPAMDGTAAVGSSNRYARADHVHPSDTSKLDASATDGVYAVDSGAQTMLDYADTSTADALVQYDSVGDINTRGLTATGTINTDTLNVANNTILNSSKLNGVAGSSNAYQVLTTVSASIDPLVMGSDIQTNTPTVKFTGCKIDNSGTINSGTSEVFFTESFGIDSVNYDESRISLVPADQSQLGGVKVGNGIDVSADGTISLNKYQDGDTLTVANYPISGFISSGTAECTFSLTLPKSLASNITTCTISTFTGGIRGSEGYVDSTTNDTDLSQTYTCTASIVMDNALTISVRKGSAMSNVSNNTVVNLRIRNLTITFTE